MKEVAEKTLGYGHMTKYLNEIVTLSPTQFLFLLILFITFKLILPFSSFQNQNFSWDGILHIFKTHQACNSNQYKNKLDTLNSEKDLTAIKSWHFSGWQGQDDSSHSPRVADFDKSFGHTQFFVTLH